MKAIVVGAGITGVSSALWLQRAGVDVTLVDRIAPGDPAQTSYGNGGILARSAIVPVSVPGLLAKAPRMLLDPGSPLFLRWRYLPRLLPWLVPFLRNGRREKLEEIVAALDPLSHDSVDQHLALARGTGAERFIETGDYVYLYRSRADYEGDALAMSLRKAHGFEIEEWDRPVLEERDPRLSPAYTFGANLPDHGWITAPGPYVAALAEAFVRQGGTLRQASVVDVSDESVTLEGGESLSADRIILAAGVWSKDMAERLGVKTPVESERGYHLLLKAPSFKPPTPYMIADAKFVATPMEAGLRCAGIVEFGGTEAAPSDAPLALLKKRIREVYPSLSWEDEETWLGHRPSTPDSLPMLGSVPNAPNVICAFGSQHIGLTIGPRLGRMVASMVTGTPPNIDLAPYRVDRFGRSG